METTEEKQLAKIREVALKSAKNILNEMGVSDDSIEHASLQYELQFSIYHAIKRALKIKA